MRRLVLEFTGKDLVRFLEPGVALEHFHSLRTLSFLRYDREEFSAVCEVHLRNGDTPLRDLFPGRGVHVQVLRREGAARCILFLQRRHPTELGGGFLGPGIYPSLPYEYDEGKARVTFLLDGNQADALRRRLRSAGISFKVISMVDARFSHGSPLAGLTPRQQEVLMTAYRLGYYEVPRRVRSAELARLLKVKESTLVRHRQKGERELMRRLMEDFSPETLS